MSVVTELVTYCENENPLESFWLFLWKQEISDVTLQSDSYLDGYLPSQICYEILVNFCGELFHSIMQASVLPSNTIASDWMGLSWKGLLVYSAMIKSKRELFWVKKKGHYVKASVSRVTSWGWWAGWKAHKHLQTFPSERWDLVEHRGAVCRQSCPDASVAVRLLCAFREMVTSKSAQPHTALLF